MQYSDKERVYQDLMQKYYEENPCFNGEDNNTAFVEEIMKYRAGLSYPADCEMGG